MEQRIGQTRLPDGTPLAYATAGSGPPLLLVDGWLSHLELSWALPPQRQLLEALADGRTLLRFDRPGCGLSGSPGGPPVAAVTPCLTSELTAIEAVLAAAAAGTTVDLFGTSLGAPVALAWAAQHPETVGRLVLYGGWARGADIAPTPVREHVVGLVAGHWGLGSDLLTDIFAPDAPPGVRAAVGGYQRQASSSATAAALLEFCYRIDVSACLADVRAPTLVLHREQDRAAPLDQARWIAAAVPDARLEILPGRSHLPWAGDVDALVTTVRDFLALPRRRPLRGPALTTRQREVAALVAEGLTNRQIGARLGIEERSAEGHIERIRLRLGVRSRAQVAAWWVAAQG